MQTVEGCYDACGAEEKEHAAEQSDETQSEVVMSEPQRNCGPVQRDHRNRTYEQDTQDRRCAIEFEDGEPFLRYGRPRLDAQLSPSPICAQIERAERPHNSGTPGPTF